MPPRPLLLPLGLSLGAMASTLCGGLFALRFRSWMALVMGFCGGVLVGLVGFELLPEITRQVAADPGGAGPRAAMGALAAGFLLFHAGEKLLTIHRCGECVADADGDRRVGAAAALALAGHSFLDGVGIGLGFQVSRPVGVVAAAAVIAHDFVDGMNTVVVMVSHLNEPRRTIPYLLLGAAAPVLGLLSTFRFQLPARALTLYLGFFAGFLLYIAASHILPRAHGEKSSVATLFATLCGASFALAVGAVL